MGAVGAGGKGSMSERWEHHGAVAAPLAALQTLHACFSFRNLEPVRKATREVLLQASSAFPKENEKEGCRGGSH